MNPTLSQLRTLLGRGSVLRHQAGPEMLIYGARILPGGVIADMQHPTFSPMWLPFDNIQTDGPHEIRLSWMGQVSRVRAHDADGESIHSVLWRRRLAWLSQGANRSEYEQKLENYEKTVVHKLRTSAHVVEIWDTNPRSLIGRVWFSPARGITCTTGAVAALIRNGIAVRGRRLFPRDGIDFFSGLAGNLSIPGETVFAGTFEAEKQEGVAC